MSYFYIILLKTVNGKLVKPLALSSRAEPDDVKSSCFCNFFGEKNMVNYKVLRESRNPKYTGFLRTKMLNVCVHELVS